MRHERAIRKCDTKSEYIQVITGWNTNQESSLDTTVGSQSETQENHRDGVQQRNMAVDYGSGLRGRSTTNRQSSEMKVYDTKTKCEVKIR